LIAVSYLTYAFAFAISICLSVNTTNYETCSQEDSCKVLHGAIYESDPTTKTAKQAATIGLHAHLYEHFHSGMVSALSKDLLIRTWNMAIFSSVGFSYADCEIPRRSLVWRPGELWQMKSSSQPLIDNKLGARGRNRIHAAAPVEHNMRVV
jgi:hypothetical protein